MQINVRFWDKKNKKMLYGYGISPLQNPIELCEDGKLRELEGEFVPMMMTGMKDNSTPKIPIFSGDIVECDLQVTAFEGMPPSFIKKRGLMQFAPHEGSFTVNINTQTADLIGKRYKVTNSRVVGDGYSNPELLQELNP